MHQNESISKTQTGRHQGFDYTITINKSPVGTYTASAEIVLNDHIVTIDMPNGSVAEPSETEKNSYRVPQSGGWFNANPYAAVVDYCIGFIDGRIDLSMQILRGDTAAQAKLERLMETETSMKPNTKPTPEQLKQMQSEIDKLVELFTVAGLSHLAGEPAQNVRNWQKRGRISATAAHRVCQLKVVSSVGFTREKLRPDVPSWVQVDMPRGGADV